MLSANRRLHSKPLFGAVVGERRVLTTYPRDSGLMEKQFIRYRSE